MPDILQQAAPKLPSVLKKHQVRTLHAFGSVCSGDFRPNSDIDLLVSFHDVPLLEYADNYFGLLEELREIFNRKVDLVVDKSITNPYFNKSIEKQKVVLYG